MRTKHVIFAAATAIAAGTTAVAQNEGGGIDVGILTCELTESKNYVIVGDAEYVCAFDPAGEGMEVEHYTANIDKVGIDLSSDENATIKWAVVAMTDNFDPGLIKGEYIGASADAAIGVGAGARVMVGGFDDTIALQPLSVEGREGFGIAVGLEQMSLDMIDMPAQQDG